MTVDTGFALFAHCIISVCLWRIGIKVMIKFTPKEDVQLVYWTLLGVPVLSLECKHEVGFPNKVAIFEMCALYTEEGALKSTDLQIDS